MLDMKLLDTRQHKDLLGTFIADMVLQLLSYVAENERLNIKQRQAEGIAAAKARGVVFGRPKKFYPENYIDVFMKYRYKELTKNQAIQLIGCKEHTFYRMLSELRKNGSVF